MRPVAVVGGWNDRATCTGERTQYHNPLKTAAKGLHVAWNAYQKKPCKSALSHGFSVPSENRGVPGSIPGLAISKDACTGASFGEVGEADWGALKGPSCAPPPFHVPFL